MWPSYLSWKMVFVLECIKFFYFRLGIQNFNEQNKDKVLLLKLFSYRIRLFMFDKTDAHWGQYDFLQTIERVTTFYYLVGQVWIPRNHHNVLHSRGRPRHKEIPGGLLLWRVFGEEPLPSRQNSHSSVLLPQSPVLRLCQTSVSTGTGYRKRSHYSKAMLDKK